MQRREFLQASLTTTTALASASACGLAVAAPAGAGRQLYEWRTYRLKDKSKQSTLSDWLQGAALPAWQRMGMGPIGVFTEIGEGAGPSIHVLLVYRNAAEIVEAQEALEKYADYLAPKKEDPAFERIDSSLMMAFAGAPQITAPPTDAPQVLELRTYESFSEDRARAKVDMFNDGEIAIFPQCGFQNVFFGETLIGPGLPNLKYMLAAPDMPANEANWKTFLAHPDFVRMKDDPKYADTVSKITKLFLEPTDYSQI